MLENIVSIMKTPSPSNSNEFRFSFFSCIFKIFIYTIIRLFRRVIIYSESSWNDLSPCVFSSWLKLICWKYFEHCQHRWGCLHCIHNIFQQINASQDLYTQIDTEFWALSEYIITSLKKLFHIGDIIILIQILRTYAPTRYL